uniref:Ribosomal biogenesis factor n=1 Tax=Geotrypetes seraphini TaxID=260995 RepID=A0A6P8QVP8_GEOSA|nr:ribosomal biogenesis factor [Geotrypetes seraphini]XP_033790621.1 ribosomal biogenesis factor [Geotrypetes seraphini]XP_033790622.1 ribosomal biogenesis factor [Geotrypetes seraphini]
MAKNKSKGQKQKNVFHVASKKPKPKNKAKPVLTNLKKINLVNDEHVRRVNKAFAKVQDKVTNLSRKLSSESQLRHQNPKQPEGEPPNIDEATNLFSQL